MITKKAEFAPRLSLVALRKLTRRLHVGNGLFDYSQTGLFQVPVQVAEVSVNEFYSVVPGTIENIKAMAKCRKMEDEAQGEKLFAGRLQKGALCFVLLDVSGNLVGYGWVMTSVNLFEDDERYTLCCSRQQAYIFDTFIQAEERGKQLYRFLISGIQEALQKEGRTEFFVLIDKANTISIRAHRKLGVLELEWYRYFCLFGVTFQSLHAKQRTRRRLGVFHGPRLFESFSLPSADISDFSLSVTALESETDWVPHCDAISQLELDLHGTLSPFHLFSAAHIWWKSDILGRYPLFLIEIAKGPDRKLVGYGLFRLVTDTTRFGKPKELIAFDDLYFMDNCFFVHSLDLCHYTLQKILEERRNSQNIRKITGADLISWHRMPPSELVLETSAIFSRWAVKKEADYPIVEIHDAQAFFSGAIAIHNLHDIKKQEKRIRNAFSEVPKLNSIDLGLLDEASFTRESTEFLELLRKTWQYKWMEESPKVDVAVYESKLIDYTKVWAGSLFPVLYFLDLGEKHIAFLYALRAKDRCWCLMIGYDPDFKTYSPGKTVFLGMLRNMSESGVKQFHLGGNVVGWKNDWQSYCSQVYVQEYFFNPKGILFNGLKILLGR
ncbi:hypothetical protein SpiGrapes_2251 [Sphaerochaeta pleomorpha str. Grapes]|uniref:N-acetyltransferase domain-containing protein n=1 Tax=Sphaerochaeta pleomorpha (strain ATCC BAA-1885 / DSM 22778 / Grapes) TaxID=158190 RepID=G8QS97_SPHPG|nr:GNAT family N-acetyltransferase [Sphaerochaeta pleomorpha]AEV30027.1 hypothetical protein SpiGrapes_2251 [Sphaerochaeta pleomorpha str. Grapes]